MVPAKQEGTEGSVTMTLVRREYKSRTTRRPVWGYDFSQDKVRYRQVGFSTRKEAEDAEKKKLIEVMSGRPRLIPKTKLTVDEYMPVFVDHRRVTRSQRTVAVEDRRARQIAKCFHNMKLTDVATRHIHAYVAVRKKQGIANRTINLELSLLRSFFRFAMQNDVANNNPVDGVKALTVVRREQRIPETEEEFMRFVDAASRTSSGWILVPWIWFRVYTGTRPSESVFMQWGDISFTTDQIRIVPKDGNELKNGQFRVVEMNPALKPILLAWRKEWTRRRKREPRPDDWLFFHPRRFSRRADGFGRSFRQAREDANMPYMTSHGLRHYFISRCVMSGIDFFTIARWVGHKNTKMIEEVYGHLNPAYRASQMKKLTIVM
jgi:integrase